MELLEREFARRGYDVEDVTVDASARPPRIVVIVDGDEPLTLDSLAELSRSASELLDDVESAQAANPADPADPYVLEVTSRGVDRPLTAPRHFRRALGRRAELILADGERLTARLGRLDGDAVRLVVAGARQGDYTVRDVALADVAEAVVQVEFSTPKRRELELAGALKDTAEDEEDEQEATS
jgi:ribosome maturation factor RimP